jgi:PiT family inorganic phosphate transporter
MENVQASLWVVVLLVMLAIAFDFMNGFHDAANSIATVVSTGVLKPSQAVVFAAFFNVVAIFVFHLSVAATVGKGFVQPGIVDTHVVFGALIGAITWNLITWYYGIPSSSSHALIGGILGAVMAKAPEFDSSRHFRKSAPNEINNLEALFAFYCGGTFL